MAEPRSTEIAKLGWGTPVELSGEQADRIRDALTSEWDRAREIIDALYSVFLPAPSECSEARQVISDVAEMVMDHAGTPSPRIDDFDDVADYDKAIAELSQPINVAMNAFDSRPAGCEMELSPDANCIECARCGLAAVIFRG